MDQKVLETQLDVIHSNLELELTHLKSQLDITFEEESDIVEKGFSFSSSLKDISRFIATNLNEHLDNPQDIFYVINNWQRFVKALDDNSLVSQNELNIFNIFTSVYYDSIDYFKKQFVTHLGEKVEFAAEDIEDATVDNFVKSTGFRQRKFEYKLEQEGVNSIDSVTASTTRRYEIKYTEREKVEMFNSIFLRFVLKPYEATALLLMVAQKFSYLEIELAELYLSSLNFKLQEGNTFIEISPPFENYSYQNECMVRAFRFNGSHFEVFQYSITYNKDEQAVAEKNLITSFNAQQVVTTNNNKFESNNVLNKFFFCENCNSSSFLNSFPTVVEFGGVKVIDEAAKIINPKIETLGNKIHPYIVEYINEPSFIQTSDRFKQSVERYKQVFLTSIATLDVNIQNENPKVDQLLQSGDLLDGVLRGANASDLLSQASNGQVTQIEVSSEGYCDLTTGFIGGGANNGKASYSESELDSMTFKGNVMSLTKEGDLKLDLMKFIDAKGNEVKLFACPTCLANGITNYIDICNESCPKCDVSLKDLRLAAEKGNLADFVSSYSVNSKDSSNNGIFGVLFDLFGVIVDLF